jgi:hypothetical protein
MINITHIYFIHNGDGVPLYVGKTVNLENRLKLHKHQKSHFTHIELIESIPSNEWKFWEEFYIDLFYSWGFRLENKTRSGRGCGARPCKWGDKISKAMKGKKPNWNDKNEIELRRQRQLGKQYTLGYKYTQEQKDKCVDGKRRIYHQYDIRGTLIKEWYATKTEIANYFNKDIGSISQHMSGKQKTAYGYIWKLQS